MAALLAVTPSCGGSPPDQVEGIGAPARGRIVFLRAGDLLVTQVGSGKTSRIARHVQSPSVSADGSAVLFARGGTWWLRRDGADVRRVPVRADDAALVLAPDASTIYFTRWLRADDGYAVAIFSMRPDGARVRQITRPQVWEDSTCDTDPDPVANGTLAYTRFSDCRHGADPSVELLARDGKPVEVLRNFNERGDFWLTKPALSRDGAWISFAAENVVLGPGTGRYVAAADGTEAHRVGGGGSAAWSPDGRWLAFADGSDVWIVRRDGSGRRRVTRTPAHEAVIAWLAGAP
jgi:hypothetical protein